MNSGPLNQDCPDFDDLTCHQCGGPISPEEYERKTACPYCGKHFRGRTFYQNRGSAHDTDKLLQYADSCRQTGYFREAEFNYRMILRQHKDAYAALWGVLLCRYGVIFVEGWGADREKQNVTCHRERHTLFSVEEDYLTVLSLAPPEKREAYQRIAAEIDETQRSIREFKNKVGPYDVFLCCREKTPGGDETEESGYARDIAKRLEIRGYRVFYAPKSLKKYEQRHHVIIIHLALQCSRTMLVIGTERDSFTSRDIRDQWRTFKRRMADDGEKTLIPLYKNPQDLPREISYEGFDLKPGYMKGVLSRLPPSPVKRRIIIGGSILVAGLIALMALHQFQTYQRNQVPVISIESNGFQRTVTWENGGEGPWHVSVLRDGEVLRDGAETLDLLVQERQVTFLLAPGYEYTFRVENESKNESVDELPPYSGGDITYPALEIEKENGYQLRLRYKMHSGEDVQALCFFLSDGFQCVRTIPINASNRPMEFRYISLDEILIDLGGLAQTLKCRIYVNDGLLTGGVFPIE